MKKVGLVFLVVALGGLIEPLATFATTTYKLIEPNMNIVSNNESNDQETHYEAYDEELSTENGISPLDVAPMETGLFWLHQTTKIELSNVPSQPFNLVFRTKYKELTPASNRNLPIRVIVELDGGGRLYADHSTIGTNTTDFGTIKSKKVTIILLKDDTLYSVKGRYDVEYR
ncbi:MAG: hypothetical protein ACRC5C_00360 [Bacilli bacterium]